MNLYNLPEPFEVKVFNRGFYEYQVSTKYKHILTFAMGSGGGGGSGFSRASGDGGGGGGGRPGSYGSFFLPASVIPKNLSITVPAGGAGGNFANGVAGVPSTIGSLEYGNKYSLFSDLQSYLVSSPGGAGSATVGGAQGSSGGSGTLNYLFPGFAYGTQNSNSIYYTGTGTNNTTNGNWTVTNANDRPNNQGLGGGGIVSSVGYNGNGMVFDSTCKHFTNQTAPGGTTGAIGEPGIQGWTTYTGAYNLFPVSYGGTGGGAGTGGVGGRGGNGGIGSGGGGGGSGTTGGRGGDGGDGIVILVLW